MMHGGIYQGMSAYTCRMWWFIRSNMYSVTLFGVFVFRLSVLVCIYIQTYALSEEFISPVPRVYKLTVVIVDKLEHY